MDLNSGGGIQHGNKSRLQTSKWGDQMVRRCFKPSVERERRKN